MSRYSINATNKEEELREKTSTKQKKKEMKKPGSLVFSLVEMPSRKPAENIDMIRFITEELLLDHKDDLIGVFRFNATEGLFNVTFSEQEIVDAVLEDSRDPVTGASHKFEIDFNGKKYEFFVRPPRQEYITMYYVPPETTNEEILNAVKKADWGTNPKIQRMTHKDYNKIQNGFIKIYFQEMKMNKIQTTLKISNNIYNIIRPEERNNPTCYHCKEKGHMGRNCPKKGYNWGKSIKSPNKHHKEKDIAPNNTTLATDEYPALPTKSKSNKNKPKQPQITAYTPITENKNKKKTNLTEDLQLTSDDEDLIKNMDDGHTQDEEELQKWLCNSTAPPTMAHKKKTDGKRNISSSTEENNSFKKKQSKKLATARNKNLQNS